MRILSLIASVALAAALVTSPALAGGSVSCAQFENISSSNPNMHVSPTQTCRDLTQCPTPSMFVSLSGPVSPAFDGDNTHQWTKRDRDGDIVKQSPVLAGDCPA